MNNGALHKGALLPARRSTILERNNNKVSLAGFPRDVGVHRASHRPIASLARSQLAANSSRVPCVRARANVRISCLTVVSRCLVTRVTSLFSIKPLDDELLNNYRGNLFYAIKHAFRRKLTSLWNRGWALPIEVMVQFVNRKIWQRL